MTRGRTDQMGQGYVGESAGVGWITAPPLPLPPQGSARGSTGSASGSTGSASGSTSKPQTVNAGAAWKRDSLASDMAVDGSSDDEDDRQGLIHFSPLPEPFLSLKPPYVSHKKSAYVGLKSGRV